MRTITVAVLLAFSTQQWTDELPPLKRVWIDPGFAVRDDGKIYVLGRHDPESGYVELYDPKSRSVDLPLRPPLSTRSRSGTTYYGVVDGDKLVVCLFSNCQVYFPASGMWEGRSLGGSNHTPFFKLRDGRILRAGGTSGVLSSSESFLVDPQTLEVQETARLNRARESFALVELSDGRVLAAGGILSGLNAFLPVISAEIFNPASGRWRLAASPPNNVFSGTRLPDGRALVYSGGTTAWIYDPPGNQWISIPFPRFNSDLRHLPNGTFLLSGGLSFFGAPATDQTMVHCQLAGK